MKVRAKLLAMPLLLVLTLLLVSCSENSVNGDDSSSSRKRRSSSSVESDGSSDQNTTGASSDAIATESTDESTDESTADGSSVVEGSSMGVDSSGEGSSSGESLDDGFVSYSEEAPVEEYAIYNKAGVAASTQTNGVTGSSTEITSGLPTAEIEKALGVAAGDDLEFKLSDEGGRSICRLSGIRLWIKSGADEEIDLSITEGSKTGTSKVAVTSAWQRVFVTLPLASDGGIDPRKAEKLIISAGAEDLEVADVSLVVVEGSDILTCTSVLPYTINSEEDIKAFIDNMSNEQKAAQICMAGWNKDSQAPNVDQAKQGLGSYLDNDKDATTFISNYNDYMTQSLAVGSKPIPAIHSADAVHGHNYVNGTTIFPHNIGLGATRNPALVERVAEVIASELAATGIRWNLSPTIAVARDDRWGRMYESFGETPEIVAPLARAYVRGMQKSGKVAATCKHFIADGGTTGWGENIAPDDTNYPIDRGDVKLTLQELRDIHLPGYIEAIDEGALSIMSAYNTWNGDKIHASGELLTDLLKDELGFKGAVVSDWNGMWLIEENRYNSVVRGLNAGLDILMAPYDVFASDGGNPLYTDVLQAITSGDVSKTRIDDALFRQLRMKWKVGLFDDPYADNSGLSVLGSQSHRDVARQAVRESLVLLKNTSGVENSGFQPVAPPKILPLKKSGQKIVVGGSHADNAGLQSGGWTMAWQGPSPDDGPYEGSTTILDGMKEMSNEVVFDKDGSNFQADADVAVIFVGEMPYAEGVGDRQASDLTLDKVFFDPPFSYINAINPGDQLSLMKQYADAEIPVVMVLVTGRPLVVNDEIDQAAAVVAAWLPGSEGAGVAEVLFGDYNFTGKLPQSWPASTDDIPINEGDGKTPKYALGFGLIMSL